MKLSAVTTLAAAALLAATVHAGDAAPKAFPAGTDSAEAAAKIHELQQRIESLRFGPRNQELATAAIEADPEFALAYLYRAYQFPPDMEALARAEELAKKAPESHRRYIELQATTFKDPTVAPNVAAIEPLLELAEEYRRPRLPTLQEYAQAVGFNCEEALNIINAAPKLY